MTESAGTQSTGRSKRLLEHERSVRKSATRTPAGVIYLSTFAICFVASALTMAIVAAIVLPALVPNYQVDSVPLTSAITILPLALAHLAIFKSTERSHAQPQYPGVPTVGMQPEIAFPQSETRARTSSCSCFNSDEGGE